MIARPSPLGSEHKGLLRSADKVTLGVGLFSSVGRISSVGRMSSVGRISSVGYISSVGLRVVAFLR